MTDDEKPPPAQDELIKRLAKGLHQPLVKSWRLQARFGSRGAGHKLKAADGIAPYLDPRRGLFYARVPETDDGTLYVAEAFHELRAMVVPAYEAWELDKLGQAEPLRTWGRRLRVWYGAREEVVGKWETAEPQPAGGRRTSQTPAAPPCVRIGALTFSRYERAMQPDGKRWDCREFTEDFERRLAFWHSLSPGEQDSWPNKRPTERRCVQWAKTSPYSWASQRGKKTRDMPYSEETWQRLIAFMVHFEALDSRLRAFLVEADESDFLGQLAGSTGLLLTGPVDGVLDVEPA